jgi:hypothetical protein
MAANATRGSSEQRQQPTQRGKTNGQANRPFKVIRRGLLKAVIWQNQTANGPMFSTQLVRAFRDGEDWKESHSLNRDDLLQAAKLLDEADDVIHREEESRRQQSERKAA